MALEKKAKRVRLYAGGRCAIVDGAGRELATLQRTEKHSVTLESLLAEFDGAHALLQAARRYYS